MPLNTQFPDWIAQQTRDDTAAGIAIGRNILEGLRLRQEEQRRRDEAPFRQRQEEQRRRDEAPFRQAQIIAYQAQAEAAKNRSAAEAFAFRQQQAADGKMADAMRFSSQLAMQGGYDNPDNRIEFYDFLGKNPELAPTQWAQNQEKLFQTADDFRAKAAEAKKNREEQIREAEIRAQATVDAARIRSEDEGVDYNAIKTAAQKNTEATIAAEKEAGIIKTPEQEAQRRAVLQQAGGKQRFLAPATLDKLVERSSVLDVTDDLNQRMLDFDRQFGQGAMQEYFGKFDKPFNEVLDIIRVRQNPQDIAALGIVQTLAGIKNRTLLTRSGLAVTENELKRLEEELGKVSDKNLPLRLRNFNANERKYLQSTARQYKDFPLPDETTRIIFGGAAPVQSAVPTGTSVAVPSSPTNRVRIKLEDLK